MRVCGEQALGQEHRSRLLEDDGLPAIQQNILVEVQGVQSEP